MLMGKKAGLKSGLRCDLGKLIFNYDKYGNRSRVYRLYKEMRPLVEATYAMCFGVSVLLWSLFLCEFVLIFGYICGNLVVNAPQSVLSWSYNLRSDVIFSCLLLWLEITEEKGKGMIAGYWSQNLCLLYNLNKLNVITYIFLTLETTVESAFLASQQSTKKCSTCIQEWEVFKTGITHMYSECLLSSIWLLVAQKNIINDRFEELLLHKCLSVINLFILWFCRLWRKTV